LLAFDDIRHDTWYFSQQFGGQKPDAPVRLCQAISSHPMQMDKVWFLTHSGQPGQVAEMKAAV